jgi:hypothetical protein
VKSLINRDEPNIPTYINIPLGHKYQPLEKANRIADCLEKQLPPHDFCDKNHKRRPETRVQAFLEAVDDTPVEKVRPYDIQKLMKTLKLEKARGLDGIPNECLRHLPRRPLVYLAYLFSYCLQLSHFPKYWKDAKFITLPKPGMDKKFPQN